MLYMYSILQESYAAMYGTCMYCPWASVVAGTGIVGGKCLVK